MKKHRPRCIYDPLFQTNFWASYGVPAKKFVKAVKDYVGIEIKLDDIGPGRCYKFGSEVGDIIWVWTKAKDLPMLAHECLHAVHFALNDKKVFLSDCTDEVYCYMLQMLMDKILKGGK